MTQMINLLTRIHNFVMGQLYQPCGA